LEDRVTRVKFCIPAASGYRERAMGAFAQACETTCMLDNLKVRSASAFARAFDRLAVKGDDSPWVLDVEVGAQGVGLLVRHRGQEN
jgi:hypothetical protein